MFQDIRTPKQSLREILPRKTSRDEEEDQVASVESRPRPARSRRAGSGRFFGWLFFFLVLGGAGYLASQAFAKATVAVTPQVVELALNHERMTVPYETVAAEPLQASAAVQTTAGAATAKKATGKLAIYNEYSSANQALVANTRFEAPNGKIYRLAARTTIPGKKADGTPGSVQAAVTADQPGSSYNLAAEAGKFTLPGFKGEPQSGKIYAKLAGAISGGSSGNERMVAESDRAKVLAELKPSLAQKALEQLRFQLPAGYLAYPEAIFFDYEEQVGERELTLIAKPLALIFKEDLLTKALVTGRLDEKLAAQPLAIANLGSLVVTPERQTLDNAKKLVTVAVDGSAKVTLKLDSDRLKTELSGAKKQAAQAIFAAYPAIARSQVSFFPPWIQGFPEDPKKININILP